jgi:hypothetical protein
MGLTLVAGGICPASLESPLSSTVFGYSRVVKVLEISQLSATLLYESARKSYRTTKTCFLTCVDAGEAGRRAAKKVAATKGWR